MLLIVLLATTLLASLLVVPIFCCLTRESVPALDRIRYTQLATELALLSKHKQDYDLNEFAEMSSQELDRALAMAPPSKPHHRTSSSTARSPDSPLRADTFKRMSTASIVTPISATSTRPNSMITAYTDEPSEISSPASRKSLSVDTNPFLTAVATQERRVLELREELQKAEVELQALKKNWAHQEATKKRTELRQNAEAMRPLKSPTNPGSAGTPTTDTFRQSMEEERRRAMHARPRIPERRVFEGRHTRTLSLLSPGTLANRAPSQSETGDKVVETPKTATLPYRDMDGAADVPRPSGRPHADSKGAREDIVNTGKQIVGDLREGLWSFWDDLRQATVGEEALKEPPLRRPSQQGRSPARPGALTASSRNNSSSTLQQPPSRRSSRSPHARSNTIAGTISATPNTPTGASQKVRHLATTAEGEIVRAEPEDDGGWSNWDSPVANTVVCTADTSSSPASTPRTSVSSNEGGTKPNGNIEPQDTTRNLVSKTASEQELMGTVPNSPSKDALPWPALKKFRPGSLQRTASNLMKEWERSLTPPAEEAEKDWIDKYIDGPRRPRAKEEAGVST